MRLYGKPQGFFVQAGGCVSRYVLRYGSMRVLGVFNTRGNDRFLRGTKVIARTQRGLEAAEVLSEATDDAAQRLQGAPGGSILRELSAEDANELSHIHDKERSEFETCRKQVETLGLPMQLVDVEHIFGGERVVVYYLSEERVDFRDLVKALASEFQTRIEMRQIGVRDEAKLLADYGDCGKPVCCNTHLLEMPPVSMRMAKLQKATLDPTKISGRCGRLKCCLRYEFDTYEELQRDMPQAGSDIVTTTGRARVLNQEILTQQLLVEMEDRRRVLIPLSDVLTVLKAGSGKRLRPQRDHEEGEGDAPPEGAPQTEGEGGAPSAEQGAGGSQPRRENRPDRNRNDRGPPRGRPDHRGGRGPREQPQRESPPPAGDPQAERPAAEPPPPSEGSEPAPGIE